MHKERRRTTFRFDPEFRFVLDLDPALEGWRAWAAAFWDSIPTTNQDTRTALSSFLVHYLHGQGLHLLSPLEFFAVDRMLPEPDAVLGLATKSEVKTKEKHTAVSDFLEWVLREQLAEEDADGHRVVPERLRNPFPRRRSMLLSKSSDPEFRHILGLDPKLDDWRQLTAEWLKTQKSSLEERRAALDKFLTLYIYGNNLERNFGRFLLRETPKPEFAQVMVAEEVQKGSQTLSARAVRLNNIISGFLDWVLTAKLGDDEVGEWDRARFHNPVPRLAKSGLATATESNKAALSIRYIKELRGLLAEGQHFRDWVWAQQAMETGTKGGDWFVVDAQIVDFNDPDCVWRERETTRYEVENKGYPARVVELWSPVRAVALYLKLELPLRTYQVRMLDSGEADTWRYVHAPQGGSFVLNRSLLATGTEKRPYQRGVFHRSQHEAGAGLYINSNKTADINKAEHEKGYVIPWAHEEALYWLEKLRNWQERYNPISAPTPWTELEAKHFGGMPPHHEVLTQRGTTCFLFRDPTDGEGNRPLYDGALERLWYFLLARLEKRCADRGEMLSDSMPLRFVDPDGRGTYFPLHALRVSLISYLILDLNLPVAVVSKLIAGHARIMMTLHYTKFGKAYMREIMAEAEKSALEAEQANHRRFLMDASFEQVGQRFAFLSEDAARAVIHNKSAAASVFEDKGICPVGGAKCDVGGDKINEWKGFIDYAPVPGYPQERNCVRCRFFITGPAFLPGLQAHFNILSEKMHRQSQRYNRLEEQLRALEKCRLDCERKGIPFLDARELERLAQREEAEAEAMGKLVNDMQATYYLIQRSIEIAHLCETDGVKLVTTGNLSDLKVAIIETQSELHQLEVVCESAVIYAETDATYAVTRRSQILDIMLRYNGMEPVFMCLTPEQQLLAGNAVMKLIQARTGTLEVALDYAECRLKLRELGVLSDELWNEIAQVTAGTPAKELIDHVRKKRALKLLKED